MIKKMKKFLILKISFKRIFNNYMKMTLKSKINKFKLYKNRFNSFKMIKIIKSKINNKLKNKIININS